MIPSSMACRFPKWITVDWDPANYNYDIDNEDRGYEARHHTPDELKHYRDLYTRYMIEAASDFMKDSAPKFLKTPMPIPTQMAEAMEKSVLIDSLNQAAKDPLSTSQNIVKVFEKIACITSQDSFIARYHASMDNMSEALLLGLNGNNMEDSRDISNPDMLLTRESGTHGSDAICDSNKVTSSNTAFSDACSDLIECNEKTEEMVMNTKLLTSERPDDGPHFNILDSNQTSSRDTVSTDSPSSQDCMTNRGNDIVSSRSSVSCAYKESRTPIMPYRQRHRDAMTVRGRLNKLRSRFFRDGGNQSEHMRRVAEDECQATAGIQVSSSSESQVKQDDFPLLTYNPSEAQIEVKASLRRRLKAKFGFSRDKTAEGHQESSLDASKVPDVHHEFMTRFSSRRRRVKEWLKKIPDAVSDSDRKVPEACCPNRQLPEIPCVSSFNISETNGLNTGNEREGQRGGEGSGDRLARDPLMMLKDSEELSTQYEDKPVDEVKLRAEGFALDQVCYDFVEGTLGEARMQRLRLGFIALLNSL